MSRPAASRPCLLTLAQVAERLGLVDAEAAGRLLDEHAVPIVHLNQRVLRVDEADLNALIARLKLVRMRSSCGRVEARHPAVVVRGGRAP